MTNKEYYKEQIFEIACKCDSIAFDERTNEMVGCDNLDCENCKFRCSIENIGGCIEAIPKWLNEKYVEPPIDWSKVEIDTKIMVSNYSDGEYVNRHFAKYENGTVYAFCDGRSSWTIEDVDDVIGWKEAKLYDDPQEKKSEYTMLRINKNQYDEVYELLKNKGYDILPLRKDYRDENKIQ